VLNRTLALLFLHFLTLFFFFFLPLTSLPNLPSAAPPAPSPTAIPSTLATCRRYRHSSSSTQPRRLSRQRQHRVLPDTILLMDPLLLSNPFTANKIPQTNLSLLQLLSLVVIVSHPTPTSNKLNLVEVRVSLSSFLTPVTRTPRAPTTTRVSPA
jgi:hypothetical protein